MGRFEGDYNDRQTPRYREPQNWEILFSLPLRKAGPEGIPENDEDEVPRPRGSLCLSFPSR